ncbi:hypothetical protein, partial [Serratia marcescens]|uniref:hypothetical protein n=1 Tax=Serratia marcescens TaxID=615 RepID=UPI0023617E1B
ILGNASYRETTHDLHFRYPGAEYRTSNLQHLYSQVAERSSASQPLIQVRPRHIGLVQVVKGTDRSVDG